MIGQRKVLPACFVQTPSGQMPVRDWLLSLSSDDRKIIGDDIKAAEFGWPIGMPLCRSIRGRKGLWEIRSSLSRGRIARIFFFIDNGDMVLLHGFEKTSQKTPDHEIEVAVRRMKGLKQ